MSSLAAFLLAAGSAPSGAIVLESTIAGTASEVGEHVGGYVRIRNEGTEPDRLVQVSCTCSRATEIHSTQGPEMVTLPGLDIPAGGTVEIRPGSGLHIMIEAARPLPAGSEVDVTLRFERAGEITRRFKVVAATWEAWPPA